MNSKNPAGCRQWIMMVLATAVLTVPSLSNAQDRSRHSDTWMFGVQCRMDWSADGQSFTSSTDTSISTGEGCTSFSDPDTGDLKLYSDGIRVWDANNSVILTGLGGNSSTMHSGTIIPAPGIPNHVYVFGNPIGYSSTVNYHLFDLTSGVAVPKGITQTISFPSGQGAEGLTTYQHPNGIDQWLFKKGRAGVFVVPVTSAGIGTPISYLSNSGASRNEFGVFAVSHDGTKVVHSGMEGDISSWDLDAQTGVLSNPTLLQANMPTNAQAYAGIFSPDSSKLYFAQLNASSAGVGSTSSITQYDYATDTFTVVSEAPPRYTYAAIGLGPDNKLYVASGSRPTQTLDVINAPNEAGAASNYVKNSVTLPAGCNVTLGITQTPSVLSRIATIGRFGSLDGPLVCGPNTVSGVVNAPDNTAVTITITDDANGASIGTCVGSVTDYAFTCATQVALPSTGNYTAAGTYIADGSNFDFEKKFETDCDAPAVAITTPVDGSSTNDTTPTLSGTTDDPSSQVTVLVKDTMGNTLQTLTPTVDGSGNWSIDATTLPEGSYTVEATTTDPAGNTSPVAGPNTFSVDTNAPSLTLDTPVDESITNDSTPSITGTTDDVTATVTVVITDDNGAVVQTLNPVVDANGDWTIDPSQLPDGDYAVAASVTDAAGNTTTAGPNDVTIDTAAPAVSLITPANGSFTNDDTPTISGTAEIGTTVSVVLTDMNGNIVETLTPTVDANGNWNIDAAQLPEGTYSVEATATDVAGNISPVAGPNFFEVDLSNPTITITNPADGSSISNVRPGFDGMTESSSMVSFVLKDAQGNTVHTATVMAGPATGTWAVNDLPADLADGTYTIEATSTDRAGNVSNTQSTFTVDTMAPSLTIDAPTMGQIIGTRSVEVNGQSDAGQVVTVEILDSNGMVIDTQTATVDANGAWTIQTTNLANGAYTARANTTDEAGNQANAVQTFSVDSDEPLIQITTPADGSTTNAVRPDITGMADADAAVLVEVKDSNGDVVASIDATVDPATGAWTAALPQDLVDGAYTIEATATRPNGKTATTTNTVAVDTMAPDTTITAPANGMASDVNQPEITGTSEPGATVDVTVTNAAGVIVFTDQVVADEQGNWTTTPDSALDDDTYTIEATSTDTVGNQGTPATSDFTVNTSTPMVTITSPSNGDTIDDSTPTISGIAEPGSVVKVLIDGEEVGEATADDQGVWTLDVPDDKSLNEGEHTIEATTTDDDGNEGSSGELTVTYTPSNTPITITSPTDGETVEGPTVVVTGTGNPGDEITVTIGGQTQTVTVGADGSWSASFDDVPGGTQTITAESGDETVTLTVTVTNAGLLEGGGCSSTKGSPTSPLWLLALFGFGLIRRRRKSL